MLFYKNLDKVIEKNKTYLCLGLDTDLEKIPPFLRGKKQALFAFNKEIIDATQDLVCAYKPQIAYYASQGAEDQLEMTINYIKEKCKGIQVILDSKRGDIDATATQYAKESFVRYQADAVTVNPYMGSDTVRPFLEFNEKGVFVLCKTSNKSSQEFQNRIIDGKPLYYWVAEKAVTEWNENHNLGLVMGATVPQELGRIRALSDEVPFLVPGVGAQGGDLEQVLRQGLNSKQRGLVINSSRAILYAGQGPDFQLKSRLVAESMVQVMRKYFGN